MKWDPNQNVFIGPRVFMGFIRAAVENLWSCDIQVIL